MKKTLLLTHEYFPFFGGVANYVYNLFKYFSPDKYLVVTDHPQVKTEKNIINIQLTNSKLRPSWLISFFKVKKIIKQHKIEQIFTPNILPLGSLSYILYKLYKIPYIISLHGLDINLALKNKPVLAKKILRSAKLILANSQNTAKLINHLDLPVNKIKVLYPSTNLKTKISKDKFLALEKKLSISDKDIVLLTVGRLNKRKGHDLVIEAMAKLNHLPLKYLIIGQGEEQENLLRLAKKYKLDKQIMFLGPVSRKDLIYYYKLANIFITPQRQNKIDVEGFGIVFLEAASCQLAIIGGQSGGVKEILTDQENALLIDPNDSQQLVKAIYLLATDQEKALRLAQQAFKRSQQFNLAKTQSKKLQEWL